MACWATCAARPALLAISVIDALICSAPAAMLCTPVLTCSEPRDAVPARAAVSAAPDCSWPLTVESCSAAVASATAEPPMVVTVLRTDGSSPVNFDPTTTATNDDSIQDLVDLLLDRAVMVTHALHRIARLHRDPP